MECFNFGLEQKLDQHSCVEFHGDSDGNSFKAQKLVIDLVIVSKCIQSNQLLKRHPSNCKRARICKPAMALVTDTHTYRRFTEGGKTGGHFVSTSFKIQQWQTTHLKDNRLACAFRYM